MFLVAVFSGGNFYHKFQFTATINFLHKALNALDFLEVIEKSLDNRCVFSVL